jgi:hypothetical protein
MLGRVKGVWLDGMTMISCEFDAKWHRWKSLLSLPKRE